MTTWRGKLKRNRGMGQERPVRRNCKFGLLVSHDYTEEQRKQKKGSKVDTEQKGKTQRRWRQESRKK